MRAYLRAAELRRQIAFLTAVVETDGELRSQSESLQTWRSEIAAQGFSADDINDLFDIDRRWLKGLERAPADILEELAGELPKAQQREEEERIEIAGRATGEPSWSVQLALAWIRFRDVGESCRFLERRDALLSLWRDGLETDELLQRLSSGELRCSGVRDGVRLDIDAADWARDGSDGLRLMRATAPYAARPRGQPEYTELRLQRQAVQKAFPGHDTGPSKAGPVLAAARIFLRRSEDPVTWSKLWTHVSAELGVSISKRQRGKLEPTLRQEFPHKFRRGAPKRK